MAAAAAPAAPRELRTFAPLFETLVPGVRHWGFAVRADGARVVQENWIEWDAPPRGVFALVAGRSGLPRLAELIPPGAGVWGVTSLATEPLRGLWRDVFGALGDDAPIGREAAEAAFTEFTKLRLFEDVVDLFDGSMLRVDATHGIEPLDSDDERAARVDERVGDRCYVLGLRDGARFATNLERALRARGLHAARKSEEYRGVRVYRLMLLGALPVEYAVTDSFLAVAVGGETTQLLLRGILDMAADRAAGRPPAELPAAVRQRLAELPDGALALEVTSMVAVAEGVLEILGAAEAAVAAEEVAPEDLGGYALLLEVPGMLRRLLPEMRRLGLDAAVSASHATKTRYTIRTLL